MKPISRKAFHSSDFISGDFNTNFGASSTVTSIKGTVKKLGEKYQNAMVALFVKKNLSPIAIRKPNSDGSYQFLGVNMDSKFFIVSFDNQNQYNAVIQDNVVPK